MDSQLAEGFGILQNRSPVPPPRFQTVERYESQQITISPVYGSFAPAARGRADHVLFCGVWPCFDEQPRPNRDFTVQLRSLQQHYTILDDDRTIIELLEAEPALYALLIDAVKPLRHAFGDKRIVHVRVQSSDEDSILKVTVQLPADFGADPERALRSFDEEWWLNNCHRSGGALVFDYEM